MTTPCFRDGFAVIAMLLVMAACDSGGGGGGGGGDPPPIPGAGDTVVLHRGIYTSSGGGAWPYELLRLPNVDGGYAYAQWFPPRTTAATPTIVVAEPYAGIDWTGEAVDQRWALRGNGCFPDTDGPDYMPSVPPNLPSSICYEKFTPDFVGISNEIYLRNNFGVLTVFGRFYAGGSVWNDVQDMVAGLQFLATQSNVDTARIGVLGTSWGGFETIYGAAYAPAHALPAAVAAVAPVIDFEQFVRFVDNDIPTFTNATIRPQYDAFYEPYLRRLFVTTGGRPGSAGANYSRVTAAALAPRLRSKFLIAHDDGDTILPIATSTSFVAANPAQTQGFWYQQSDTPIDYNTNILTHGPVGAASVYPPAYSFALGFLFTAIGHGVQALIVPYGDADFSVFFANIHKYRMKTRVGWVVPRLLELCDARVTMYDLTSGSSMPIRSGPELLAMKINAAWNSPVVDVATVCNQLATSGLPP